jgi:hypothetical protein
MTIESIIRPFVGRDVTPKPFTKPGSVGVPNIHISVGLVGGTKTFGTSGSGASATLMGNVHTENGPSSEAITAAMEADYNDAESTQGYGGGNGGKNIRALTGY